MNFLSRSKHLLISWLQSPSAVILEPPKIKSDTASAVLFISFHFMDDPFGIKSNRTLCLKWPKYQSFIFSIIPSDNYSGLIYFRIDWFDLFAVQGAVALWCWISSLALSFLYGPTLASVHDCKKNHSFDYMDLCQQSNVSAFQYTVY